jgi:sugar transferase (PEP-CTERM/EpsH1 system associated)
MRQHIQNLTDRAPLFATFAYSSAMGPYVPSQTPLVLDFVDVDSEKWFQFGATRFPGWLYRIEGRRLREQEARQQQRAVRTFVTTEHEAGVLAGFAGKDAGQSLENGVDAACFDPAVVTPAKRREAERPLVFVGAMDYFPNADAVCWFAENVFPEWRRRCPNASFWIVGRSPSKRVRALARHSGILVTGNVTDVRPYFAAAEAVVAPLRIARGIQNKVLEALAMGKQVLASPEVAACFGAALPEGITVCQSPGDYMAALSKLPENAPSFDITIRESARRRFSWEANLQPLREELNRLRALSLSCSDTAPSAVAEHRAVTP